jgi:hypothetical protein
MRNLAKEAKREKSETFAFSHFARYALARKLRYEVLMHIAFRAPNAHWR